MQMTKMDRWSCFWWLKNTKEYTVRCQIVTQSVVKISINRSSVHCSRHSRLWPKEAKKRHLRTFQIQMWVNYRVSIRRSSWEYIRSIGRCRWPPMGLVNLITRLRRWIRDPNRWSWEVMGHLALIITITVQRTPSHHRCNNWHLHRSRQEQRRTSWP